MSLPSSLPVIARFGLGGPCRRRTAAFALFTAGLSVLSLLTLLIIQLVLFDPDALLQLPDRLGSPHLLKHLILTKFRFRFRLVGQPRLKGQVGHTARRLRKGWQCSRLGE